MAHTNNVFELTTIEPVRRLDSDSETDSPNKKGSKDFYKD